MKWLFPLVFGSAVVALAVSFPRAQDTSSAPDNLPANTKAAENRPTVKARSKDAAESTTEGAATAIESSDARGGAGAAEGEEVKIYALKRSDATASRDVILALYPAEFRNRSKISADVRTNTLILRGPPELLMVIEAVLMRLEDSEATKRPEGNTAAEASFAESRPEGMSNDMLALARDYRQYEQQAAALAKECAALLKTKPDSSDYRRLKSELEGAVHSAFHARQALQRAEAARLRSRLATIDGRIAARSQIANEVIARRVEALLHPEQQWESADEAGDPTARPVPSGWKAMAGRSSPSDADTPSGISTEVPLAATKKAPRRTRETDSTATSLEGTTNPRQVLLDAEAAIDAARGAAHAAAKTTKLARADFERMQTLAQNGTIPQKSMQAAEETFLHEDARLAKAKLDLQQAERKAALAREDLDAQIRIKEIDLTDAQLRLENATTEESRARTLLERQAIAKEEYDQKRVALEQAKLQVERAATLLELFRKALPAKSSDGEDRPNDNPAPQW